MAELNWTGKYDESGNLSLPDRTVYLLKLTEKFFNFSPEDLSSEAQLASEKEEWSNSIIKGDCCQVLSSLMPQFGGQIDLIYLDPPFFTQSNFKTSSKLTKSHRADALEINPDIDLPSTFELDAYSDRWVNGLDSYLQWLFETLTLLRDLLSEKGSIYLHLDWHASHYAKAIMDEIFGTQNFQNDIAWCYREAINSSKRWNRKHDSILFYSKDIDKFYFNPTEVLQPHSPVTLKKYKHQDEKGKYRLMGRGIVGSPIESARDVSTDWEQKRPELVYRHYLREGTYPVDYWNIDIINQAAYERTGYPTQKPIALLERIIRASSKPGDLVLDCCCGSGTTAVASEMLGRRWIAVDSGAAAILMAKKRLCSLGEISSFNSLEIDGLPEDCKESIGAQLNVGFERNANRVIVKLQGYERSREALPDVLKNSINHWNQWIVTWAVDWDYDGEVFVNRTRFYRDKKVKNLICECSHSYDNGYLRTIMVKAEDILGHQSSCTFTV